MSQKIPKKRANLFLARLAEQNRLDAILITDLSNISYLTSFRGSEGTILFSPKQSWFLTDFRYQEQAEQEVSGCRIKIFKNKIKELQKLISKLKVKRLGFEPQGLSVQFYLSLKKELKKVKLVPLKKSLLEIRACKEPEEIEKIEKAVNLSEKALANALLHLKPGIQELDLAAELEYQSRKMGSGWFAFDTIVASGPRGALPHAKASTKTIKKGELIVIDFGVNYQGYYSDLTVTVALGDPGAKARKVYQIVAQAQKLAIEQIRPGQEAKELDRTARAYIQAQGFGKFFGHGLGHGIGLAVHEEPGLNPRSNTILQPGMVFTIEPGIYLPGEFGVRIEDDLVLEDNKVRLLSHSNQPLKIFE